MVNPFKVLIFLFTMLPTLPLLAQHYHAMHGSSYAGSVGIGNNPASMVNTPFAWDLDILSTQTRYTTNAATIYKYSLLSSAGTSEYAFDNGNFKRYAAFNYNTNILNARIALGRKQAIGFGMNLRGYGNIRTSAYNYVDTVKKIAHVLKLNNDDTRYEANVLHSSWIEIFASYARTVFETETGRLTAGLTIKAMRGISGAHAQMKDIRFQKQPVSNTPTYQLVSGELAYGYSSNYDVWNDGKTAGDNLMNFLSHSEGGLSADLGAEYIVKSQGVTSFHEEENYFDYEWKLGLSILDIGQNNYKYGNNSRTFSGVKPNLNDATLQKKFSSIKSLRRFNDSLTSIANNTAPLRGMFTIINPVRLVMNVDRNFGNDFYFNSEVSVNLSSLAGNKNLYLKEVNIVAVTPRWETRKWGAYLPFTYTNEGRLWVGGAFKAGPLLMGIHNWGNVFSSKKMANGGGYLALVIRANHFTRDARDKRFDCPRL